MPAHYSTGVVEAKIADIREILERRRWTFRKQARTNLLLGLVRLGSTVKTTPDAGPSPSVNTSTATGERSYALRTR